MTVAQQASETLQDHPLVEAEDLRVHFPVKIPFVQSLLSRERLVVHAVDGVSFKLHQGEVFGLVGESGCGKTTLGRAVLRLVEPTSGKLRFDGQDITHLHESRLRPLRQKMQIVFQDPHASLNPAMTIGQAIGHPLRIHGLANSEGDSRPMVAKVMQEVGLTPEDQLYDKYPADLSGGQRQRAVIARAIILKPRLIVADEPVAMLDMSIRARVLQLMLALKEKYGLTYLFITHDLATAKFVCNRIAIMYLGRLVELGDANGIFSDPKHPYTKALLKAVPVPDPRRKVKKEVPKGEVPDAIYPPAGCRFHPRCPMVLPTCGWEGRDFINWLEERWLDPVHEREESPLLGPAATWRANGQVASREVKMADATFVLSRLHAMIEQAPKPMAQAVKEIGHQDRKIFVEFRSPDSLLPRDVEGRLVECLLY